MDARIRVGITCAEVEVSRNRQTDVVIKLLLAQHTAIDSGLHSQLRAAPSGCSANLRIDFSVSLALSYL